MIYTRQQDVSTIKHKYHYHIVNNFDFYIHLAMTGILNSQNPTFLVKVMRCFIKFEKSEFSQMRIFSKIGKLSDVPAASVKTHFYRPCTMFSFSLAVYYTNFNLTFH